MRIVVTGLLGNYAFGGVAWDYIQYALGFQKLGHDVWYLEDTGAWAYDPVKQEPSPDCSHNVAYLRRIMEHFGFGDRWIYRNAATEEAFGIDDPDLADRLLREADVLANVSGACWLREPTAAIPRRLFLDGDPMFTQAKIVNPGGERYRDCLLAHTKHFSFGLNIGDPDCAVPTAGIRWIPTVQPIALEYWDSRVVEAAKDHPAAGALTTVMNWASYRPVEFEGKSYGQKDLEFRKFLDLPSACPGSRFVVAMGQGVGSQRPTAELEARGWHILEPDEALPDFGTYREFLAASLGEWSIAKHGYVAANTGWFSCRSACYLALGRPVVVQDTGWTRRLPSGDGALAFSTVADAAAAIEQISSDWDRHSQAARAFARDYLEAGKVCQELLEAGD